MNGAGRLEHFPISFFALAMGLAGLTIAWEKGGPSLGLTLPVGHYLLGVTAAAFTVLLVLYASKALRYGAAVRAEFRHPVKLHFFPTISISLVLLAIAGLSLHRPSALVLWVLGSSLHLVFTLYVVNVWIHHSHFEIHHMNPAWFIPVVGNVLVPIAGVPLGYTEISWLFFSIGIVFWLVLFTIIFNRVLFHHPLPDRLMPTLFILIAPPAVGFIAYTKLTGGLDPFGRILYYAALFLTVLLLSQARRFLRLPFFLSWWAYSFPLAAIAIATMRMAELTGRTAFDYLSLAFLALLSALIAYLLYRTSLAIHRRGVCVPEQ